MLWFGIFDSYKKYQRTHRLDLIRGTFVLHTRGYNAAKPLNPESNFAQLYARAATGAALQDPAPQALVKLGSRDGAEQAAYNKVYARLRPTSVEPPFMPKPPWKLVQLKSILGDGSTSGRPKEVGCLYAERSPGTYGPLKDLEVKRGCADAKLLEAEGVDLPKNIERHTWMWHADSGYIRPAIREPGRIYCLDKGKSNVCACANEQCAFQVQEAIRGHVLLNSVHSCILLIFIQKTGGRVCSLFPIVP